jgi:hypothetical protein
MIRYRFENGGPWAHDKGEYALAREADAALAAKDAEITKLREGLEAACENANAWSTRAESAERRLAEAASLLSQGKVAEAHAVLLAAQESSDGEA